MLRTVFALTIATLICAATYEACRAAPIAPLTGIPAGSGNITLAHSHHYQHSHQYIVVPLTLGPWSAGDFGVTEPVLTT